MIPNEEKEGWYYLAVKKLSALLHRITSKNKGDFYCLDCLHSFRTENKLEMSTIWAFDNIENKHTLYRGKDCVKKFCEFLREHAKNITGFEKKKMLPLTKEELKSYHDAKVCYICGKRILIKFDNDKSYRNV